MSKKEKSPFRVDRDIYYYLSAGTVKPPLTRKLRIWINELGLHCVALYRYRAWVGRLWSRSKLLGLVPMIIFDVLSFLQRTLYQVHIQASTVGPGLYIGHVGTTYIGPSKIGKNFCVAHNVTIGVGHNMKTGITPTFGDNVWIGTGAIISGGITIGNNVTISAGTVLSRDVPDGCLVGGNPGRVIMKEYDNSNFIVLPPDLRDKPVPPEDSTNSGSTTASEIATD